MASNLGGSTQRLLAVNGGNPPKRPAESTFGRFFFSHWVPITQAVLSTILCATLLYFIDGALFSPSQRESYTSIWNENRQQ